MRNEQHRRFLHSIVDLLVNRFKVSPNTGDVARLRSIADRQQALYKWAGEIFGEDCLQPQERARRFIEEAVELVQCQGMPLKELLAIIHRVYLNPSKDDAAKELGQTMCTLESFAESIGLHAQTECDREFGRCLVLPIERFHQSHQKKVDLGIATPLRRKP